MKFQIKSFLKSLREKLNREDGIEKDRISAARKRGIKIIRMHSKLNTIPASTFTPCSGRALLLLFSPPPDLYPAPPSGAGCNLFKDEQEV